MNSIQYSELRQHLAENLDKVYNNHKPLLITRKNGKNTVLMSYEDFKGMEETFYLLSNPNNAKKLLDSIEQVKEGKVIQKDMDDYLD